MGRADGEGVDHQGWDNRTFRLGDDLAVRLPSAEGYVAAVEKEHLWLPYLVGQVPYAVPTVVALGRPGCGYPFTWSVRRWLHGETVGDAAVLDRDSLATDLGSFLAALWAIPAKGGPEAGAHSSFRGCHLSVYTDQVEAALEVLSGRVDVAGCRAVWIDALATTWPNPPAWFHGDVAVGNLLVQAGRLSSVIDFGSCGVGDPACDLTMAWTYFTGPERTTFRRATGTDDDTWHRARGWTLWKALATLAGLSNPDHNDVQRKALSQVLQDAESES